MTAAEKPDFDVDGLGRLMSAAFAVNSNSAWNRGAILRWYPAPPKDVSVVYYGSAIEDGAPRAAGAAPARPFILCVARLAEYKGLDVLSMAFAELAAEHPEVDLVLCGADHSGGGLQRFVQKLGLEDRVRYLGQLPHEQVLDLMSACLFLVLPSRRESLGGSLIEAMRAGKAVVASRVGGIPELVRDGIEGLLVEPQDVPALTGALRRLLLDAALRDSLGRRGRDRSAEFTWDKALDAYVDIYRTHPAARSGGGAPKSACVIWDRVTDATALAMLGNLARGLRGRDREFCACLRRGRWDEPFRSETDGWPLYRLGFPPESRLRAAEPLVVLAQLLWILRAERVRLWHHFVIRYRELGPLTWLARLTGNPPVVSLY